MHEPLEHDRACITRKIPVEAAEVVHHIDGLHESGGNQHLRDARKPMRNGRHERARVRNNPANVRVAVDNAVCHKVEHRARGIGDVLEERRRTCGEDSLRHGGGKRRMDGHHGRPLVEEGHQRIEQRVAQIDAVSVARQLDTQGTELVETATCLLYGSFHSRYGQCSGEAQTIRVTSAHVRKFVVDGASQARCQHVVSSVDVRRRDGEHAKLLACLLHETQMRVFAPHRCGKTILLNGIHTQLGKGIEVGFGEGMAVDINGRNGHGWLLGTNYRQLRYNT